MPELPEVQCFVDSLNKSHLNARLKKIVLRRGDIRFPLDKEKLQDVFAPGAHLKPFERIGKQIIVQTNRGRFYVGLGMSGYFTPTSTQAPFKHEHITLLFEKHEPLGFVDARRFGFWRSEGPTFLVDPLDEKGLLKLFLSDKFCHKKNSIKEALMDQNLIGGIGNIYAVEALHHIGVHPQTQVANLMPLQFKKLAKVLPRLLKQAIVAGGSTISTYRNLHGEQGNFQAIHRVYGRAGEKCLTRTCKGVIVRIEQGGRGSWFCPQCQPV